MISDKERQKFLSARHSADMQSDNWLSKSIRPLSLLILLFLETLIVVLSALGYSVDTAITTQLGALLMGAFGFYVNSRRLEKVATIKASSEEKKSRMETKAMIKEKRKLSRHQRKIERRKIKTQNGFG